MPGFFQCFLFYTLAVKTRSNSSGSPLKRARRWVHAPLGLVQLCCTCSETANPWVSFTSCLPTLSFQAIEVGTTETKPCTGHGSSGKKFLPTWGVPGTSRRGYGSTHWSGVDVASQLLFLPLCPSWSACSFPSPVQLVTHAFCIGHHLVKLCSPVSIFSSK
jgi:hypothetical protein